MAAEKKEIKATIIDGTDLILGRTGSNIAKRLLLGEEIRIVNCKDMVILGKKSFLLDRYKSKLSNKVVKQGPYYSRAPADLVKRSFRNMLPHTNKRGTDALKRLTCYTSTPSILLNTKKETVESAKVDDSKAFYYTKVGTIAQGLGYTKQL